MEDNVFTKKYHELGTEIKVTEEKLAKLKKEQADIEDYLKKQELPYKPGTEYASPPPEIKEETKPNFPEIGIPEEQFDFKKADRYKIKPLTQADLVRSTQPSTSPQPQPGHYVPQGQGGPDRPKAVVHLPPQGYVQAPQAQGPGQAPFAPPQFQQQQPQQQYPQQQYPQSPQYPHPQQRQPLPPAPRPPMTWAEKFRARVPPWMLMLVVAAIAIYFIFFYGKTT